MQTTGNGLFLLLKPLCREHHTTIQLYKTVRMQYSAFGRSKMKTTQNIILVNIVYYSLSRIYKYFVVFV